jgi:hypothetical protein
VTFCARRTSRSHGSGGIVAPIFELFVSLLVEVECQAGDPEAASDRLAAISGLPPMEATGEVTSLGDALVRGIPNPPKSAADAVHSASAAVHGIQCLFTWNYRHIANAMLRPRIEAVCRASGFEPPLICTPEQLRPPEVGPWTTTS